MAVRRREGFPPSHPIVVYCPSFDENSGGTIVLHYLVDRLRASGIEAYARPWVKEYGPDLPRWKRTIKVWNQNRKARAFVTHPSMNVPVAPDNILQRAIAVYPEITSGNPLGAPHVVRWLLNRKGFFNSPEYGDDELTFYFHTSFLEGSSNVDPDNLLRIRWFRDDVYFDRGRKDRSGACRMLRKGEKLGLVDIPKDDDAILIDGLDHDAIADIFNKSEIFYCHDPYTMYAYYAALCGCLPIIVPQPNVSEIQWRSRVEERWGLAYGSDNVDWAKSTRKNMISQFQNERENQDAMVSKFIDKVAIAFK